MGRLKRFGQELGKSMKGIATGFNKVMDSPVLKRLEESDRIMQEKIKKATGGID